MSKGKSLKIFSGNGNLPLAQRIAAYLGTELGRVEVDRHPDGEVRVKFLEDLRGSHVVIIQPTGPPETNLREANMMGYAACSSAACVTLVTPFYGYGRQDWKDEPRVGITARQVADEITAAGFDRVIALDLHAKQIQGFFHPKFCKVDHLWARPVFVSLFRHLGLVDFVNGPPDTSRAKLAEAYEQRLGGGMFFAHKRKANDRAKSVAVVGEVEGKKVRVIDDVISTGTTLALAAGALHAAGAVDIHAVASHGEFVDNWADNLLPSLISTFFVGDSVQIPNRAIELLGDRLRRVTVAPLIGEAIKHVDEDESVSVLFDDEYVAGLYRGSYFV